MKNIKNQKRCELTPRYQRVRSKYGQRENKQALNEAHETLLPAGIALCLRFESSRGTQIFSRSLIRKEKGSTSVQNNYFCCFVSFSLILKLDTVPFASVTQLVR